MGLLRKIRETGRVAEPAPPPPEGVVLPSAREFGGSVQVRCVDAGSCNGCEIEIAAAFNPVYDAERYGARMVASPRHADVALVTGTVTRNMAEPLRRTVAAMGEPHLVVAVGDCALNCGEFAGGMGEGRCRRCRTRWSGGAWLPAGAGGDRGGAAAGDRPVSLVPAVLAAACGLGGAGVSAGAVLSEPARVVVAGVCTAGVAALGGERWAAGFPGLVPLAGAYLAVDALAGLSMTVAGAVIAAVALHGIGYAAGHGEHGLSSRTGQALLPLFALNLVLVPAAASVATFLVLWELMALASLLLVWAEHRERASVQVAGVWYGVMAHLGLVLPLAGLALFAARVGGETFGVLRAGACDVSPTVRGWVFVLTAAAFTSKAGAVPLHAWLPRAHPEAPSQVSALMNAVGRVTSKRSGSEWMRESRPTAA